MGINRVTFRLNLYGLISLNHPHERCTLGTPSGIFMEASPLPPYPRDSFQSHKG